MGKRELTARIVDQDVQLVDCLVDGLCSSADRGTVSQVQLDEKRFDIGVAGLDFVDDGLDLALGAAGEDDEFWLACGEVDGGLSSYSALAGAGNEN